MFYCHFSPLVQNSKFLPFCEGEEIGAGRLFPPKPIFPPQASKFIPNSCGLSAVKTMLKPYSARFAAGAQNLANFVTVTKKNRYGVTSFSGVFGSVFWFPASVSSPNNSLSFGLTKNRPSNL